MDAKTVIVVIHQPRLSVFELFDRCVVFGVGKNSVGRVFDAGPRKMVAARLLRRFLATGLGDQPPNVADVLLDVVTAATPEETETAAVVHTDRWVSGKWSSTGAPGAGEAGADLEQSKGTTYQDRFLALAFKAVWERSACVTVVVPALLAGLIALLGGALPNLSLADGPELHEATSQIMGLTQLIPGLLGSMEGPAFALRLRPVRWLQKSLLLDGGEKTVQHLLLIATQITVASFVVISVTAISLHRYMTLIKALRLTAFTVLASFIPSTIVPVLLALRRVSSQEAAIEWSGWVVTISNACSCRRWGCQQGVVVLVCSHRPPTHLSFQTSALACCLAA